MIRVLIVEDQPIVAAANAKYVGRIPGFEVGGQALTGADALRHLSVGHFDLVLLDIYLPDMHGLDVVRAMRAAGHAADVIIVTRARDLDLVRSAVSYGIVHYLIKPFTFAIIEEKLTRYRTYRTQAAVPSGTPSQHDVDRLLRGLHGSGERLPRNVNRSSLDAVIGVFDAGEGAGGAEGAAGRSAAEVAEALGVSRVTARRYLEYLAETGALERGQRYRGAGGRPETEYRRPASNDHP
jgi:response regulator of citrate/malate metabolism